MGKRLEAVRAAIGATVLDVLKPGWHERIDLDILDLSSCQRCVLGQLFGDYEVGASRLFAFCGNEGDDIEQVSRRAGFNLGPEELWGRTYDETPEQRPTYSQLSDAWRREIVKRKKKARSKAAVV